MKNKIIGLLVLLCSATALAAGPVIFYGDYARLIPEGGLNFSRSEKLLADLTADPTILGSVASVGSIGMYNDSGTGKLYLKTGSGDTAWTLMPTAGGGGSGDVVGPASATDNAVVRFDSTTGKLVQNSSTTLSDANILTTGNVILSSLSVNTVPYLDGSKQLTSSAVTPTQLGYLDATSSVQTQLNAKQTTTLADGKILVGDGTNTAAAVTPSGDILFANTGATSIAPLVIVDADVSASAAISRTKIANGTASHVVINDGSGTLSSEASLSMGRGGTAKALSPITGGVVWSDGDSMEVSVGGSTGQILQSNGASAPTWYTPTYGATDHGALTGLTDDDHTIYSLLAGRATGQTITGGTAASDKLTLRSTSNGTKGQVYLDETTPSTSTTSGALVVAGGVGVAGKLVTGNGLTVAGPTSLAVGLDGPIKATAGVISSSAVALGGAEVTGTLLIANGGTSNTTASAAFNALSPLVAKGQVLGFSTVNGQLPPGTDAQVLTVDSTATFGVKWATASSGAGQDSSYELTNLSIAASVGSSALTIALKTKAGDDPSAGSPVKIAFRNATLTTGTYTQVSATAATSLVISSGSTMGFTSAVADNIYIYAINNAGTIELAASTALWIDEGTVYTSTAEGGAGGADSRSVLYSTTARTAVAIRLIGKLKATEATAGTWATAPSEISLPPFKKNFIFSRATQEVAVCHIRMSTGGSVSYDPGNCVSSVTDETGTSYWTINFNAGTFANEPQCTCTSVSAIGVGPRVCNLPAMETTYIRTSIKDASDNQQDVAYSVLCMGVK